MSYKSYVVLGEAPESDSEEEICVKYAENAHKSHGKVIGGEAPESDEESNVDTVGSQDSISSALSASSLPSLASKKEVVAKKSSSLLVKKLRERNASLHKNMKEFVGQTIVNAGNDLNITNQLLLKCQVQLQEASDLMKTIKTSISQLDDHFQSLSSTSFIPLITVNDKE